MHHGSIVTNDISRAIAGGAGLQETAEEGGPREFVDAALGLVRRQYLVILITTALALAGSVIYLRITPPTYKATAKILLENPKAQFVQQQSFLATPPVDRAQLENQLVILTAKPIAVSVISKLNLADDPDLTGSNQGLRSLFSGLRNTFGLQASKAPPQSEPSDDIITAFQNRLGGMHVGQSNVIEISFNSSNAERASQIANAVTDAYLADQLNAKFDASRTATTWLQKRLAELAQQALLSERAVNEYKLKNNMVAVGGSFVDEQQVTELNSRMVIVREQASDALARLNRYQTVIRSNSVAANSRDPDLDAPVSDTLSNQIINSLRQQYLEHARRESEWSARLSPNHLAVVDLRAKMNELRTSIAAELRRLAETSRNDYETARQRENAVGKQLASAVEQSQVTNSAELTMRELEMNAKSYRSLYDSFLQQYMRSIQQQSFPITDARVISYASPPQGKSKPKSTLILAFGLVCGMAVGVAFGLLRDVMDRAFRTTEQVKSALQTTCLALVPLVDYKNCPEKTARRQLPGTETRVLRTIIRGSDTLWTASGMPLSHFAESIRFIKLAINLSSTGTPNKIIGITSSLPNEGKSTIAAAVGECIAQSGARVIVVDCDLRNPSLSAILAPNADAGLLEVMSGQRSPEETIWRDEKTNLEFLPAVSKSQIAHSSDILSAEATRKLFDTLRATYDYVIVDLPPLTPIVDVRATTPWIDGYILTIEWGRTDIDVVRHALNTAPDVRQSLIGAILNKADMNAIGRYDRSERPYPGYKNNALTAA
jgi:succinoglycan biosynthesis transport protein ExoP